MKRKLNISIDDMSPHPKSSVLVLDRCFELIRTFPKIKFTMFVPMAYTRMGEKTYRISEDPEFCRIISGLPKDNFELGWHGYYHGIIGKSNNDEFQNLNYKEAIGTLNTMFEEASKSGVKDLFSPIFRPSAFRMSPSSFDACWDVGISTLALSSKDRITQIYRSKNLSFSGKIVYYNINPPADPLNVYDKMEVVYHACEWDRSFLNVEKTKELETFVGSQIDDIDFVFMGDM